MGCRQLRQNSCRQPVHQVGGREDIVAQLVPLSPCIVRGGRVCDQGVGCGCPSGHDCKRRTRRGESEHRTCQTGTPVPRTLRGDQVCVCSECCVCSAIQQELTTPVLHPTGATPRPGAHATDSTAGTVAYDYSSASGILYCSSCRPSEMPAVIRRDRCCAALEHYLDPKSHLALIIINYQLDFSYKEV